MAGEGKEDRREGKREEGWGRGGRGKFSTLTHRITPTWYLVAMAYITDILEGLNRDVSIHTHNGRILQLRLKLSHLM